MVSSLDREWILKMKEKLTGQLTTTMICTTCNTPAQGQYNDFNCLTLFLPKRGFKTIDDALKKRFRATALERTCPTCNSKRAQQREVINTLPQVLVLQKGRFQNSREKIQTDIHQKSDWHVKICQDNFSNLCVYVAVYVEKWWIPVIPRECRQKLKFSVIVDNS